jgi:hypothetical protein
LAAAASSLREIPAIAPLFELINGFNSCEALAWRSRAKLVSLALSPLGSSASASNSSAATRMYFVEFAIVNFIS